MQSTVEQAVQYNFDIVVQALYRCQHYGLYGTSYSHAENKIKYLKSQRGNSDVLARAVSILFLLPYNQLAFRPISTFWSTLGSNKIVFSKIRS
jgi:hypothetical protein